MAITFSCGHCGKSLTTSEDKAGRKAKCPGCGEVVSVPALEGAALDTSEGDDDEEFDDDLPAVPDRRRSESDSKTCPMCGAENARRAKSCTACGEKFEELADGPRTSRSFDVGEVISASWTIYKNELGIVLGSVLVAGLVSTMVSAPTQIINFIGDLQRQQGQEPNAALSAIGLLLLIPSYLVGWFLNIGVTKVLYKVARGKETSIGEIFSGSPYFMKMIGATIVFGIMIAIGSLLCVVPGVLVMLMFWPYTFVLVDENPDGINCLWRAKEITQGNWGSAFVLFLAAFAICLVGLLAFCVGIIFAAPLAQLTFAVAYCHMTGQRTAE